jgi:CRP-like cAMP-binding protein
MKGNNMSAKYTLKKGQVLFKEGSFSDAAFIIESGKVEISKTSDAGEKMVIGVLKDNDIVGEMGLIDGHPRSATVTAVSDVRIKEITRDQFETLSKTNPNALIPILKVLTLRLRSTLKMVVGASKRKKKNKSKKMNLDQSMPV